MLSALEEIFGRVIIHDVIFISDLLLFFGNTIFRGKFLLSTLSFFVGFAFFGVLVFLINWSSLAAC